MNKKKTSFLRWFTVQFSLILKKPDIFFHQKLLQKFSIKSIWFGTICLSLGIGIQTISEMIFLYWSENIFKTSPQKFLNFIDNLSINNNNNTLSFLELLNILKIQKTLTLILTPFIAFFSIYLFSGVLYIMIKGLKLNQKQKANYDNTLQLVAFCQAPMIISFIPIIGPLISPIWCIMLLLRGITTLYFGNTIIKFIIILLPGLTIKFMWIYSLDIIASSI